MSASIAERDESESEYERATREFQAAIASKRAQSAKYRELGDWLIKLARGQQERRDDNESQDRIGAATIAKVCDTALKAYRTADELDADVFEGLHDLVLTANEREMAGLGRRAH